VRRKGDNNKYEINTVHSHMLTVSAGMCLRSLSLVAAVYY
jgi:hypothetical protein